MSAMPQSLFAVRSETMLGAIFLACLLTSIGPGFAQIDQSVEIVRLRHQREDQALAHRNGLTPEFIRQARIAAGISDVTNAIETFDAKSFSQRHQILVVAFANTPRHCISVHVLEEKAGALTEIWSLKRLKSSTKYVDLSEGICRQGPVNPSASATPDGNVVVRVPVVFDPSQRNAVELKYNYLWDGSSFVAQESQ